MHNFSHLDLSPDGRLHNNRECSEAFHHHQAWSPDYNITKMPILKLVKTELVNNVVMEPKSRYGEWLKF